MEQPEFGDICEAMIDGHAQFDWVAKKDDGSEFPVEVRLRRLVRDQEATSVDQPALLAMVRDLSAQRRAEEAKRSSEGKLREILAVVPVGIARLDKLKIKWANAELLRMLGYSGCQLLSRSISMLFETEEEFTRVGKELVSLHARHETGDAETRWRRMDGALLDVHIRYTWRTEQEEDDLGRMVIAVYDITHRRQAEMALRESEKRYRNFAEILGEADSACRRAKSLTQQLLTFSRGGKPVKKVVALDSLLREVTSFSLRGTSVTCHVSLPQDLPFVEADEGQLGQVVQNLLINAVQAMPDGGVITVTGQVLDLAGENYQGLPAGSYVEIVVEDQGTGIPVEHMARIFEPYFTTKKTGSGLGLAVAYSILKNHGGAIAVDSIPGEGTVFRLRLPVAGPAGQVVLARSSGAVKGTGRVLVMDDEQLIRTITGEMLKVLGYTTVTVEEGGRAVQMYAEAMRQGHPFRAVILDLTVPGGMGGKEAAQKILAVDPSARIIVASGYAQDAVMADYRRYGFVAVTPKPFSITELAEALTQALVENV